MDAVDFTFGLFFEIKDSWIYGGEGSTGYSEIKLDLLTKNNFEINVRKCAKAKRGQLAKLCDVPIEKVKNISREEYEENTED